MVGLAATLAAPFTEPVVGRSPHGRMARLCNPIVITGTSSTQPTR
jgi:hypothetical protein